MGSCSPNFRLNQQIPTQSHLSTKTHQPTTKKNKQNTEPQPKVHPPKIPSSSPFCLFSWSFSSPPLLRAFRSLPAVSPQPPSAASPAAATIRRASAGGRRGPWRRPRCEDEELQRPPKCWSREGGRPVKVWRYIPLFLSYSTSLAKLFVCLFVCLIGWLIDWLIDWLFDWLFAWLLWWCWFWENNTCNKKVGVFVCFLGAQTKKAPTLDTWVTLSSDRCCME